jgi:hypothetical protein
MLNPMTKRLSWLDREKANILSDWRHDIISYEVAIQRLIDLGLNDEAARQLLSKT